MYKKEKRLDQFYTCPYLANNYTTKLLKKWPNPDVLFIEPSAGTGAFTNPLTQAGRKFYAFDLDPKAPHIIQTDFLLCNLQHYVANYSTVVVLGNPPFGKNSTTAIKFFNKVAPYASEIAFIVPRTFRKFSIQKQLHSKFHLTEDQNIKPYAFIRHGESYDVPCAWQIWTKQKNKRITLTPPSIDHLLQYTAPIDAEFAMRRVGFYAGQVITKNIASLSTSSHYFMRELTDGVIDAMRRNDWTKITKQTAGVRSLSKAEIAFTLNNLDMNNYSINQTHGNCFEEKIRTSEHEYFSQELPNRSYLSNAIFDINAEDDVQYGLATSIKTAGKNNPICLSDARRFWHTAGFIPYRLLVGFYQQIRNTKKFYEIREFILQPYCRSTLLGKISEKEITHFHEKLKTYKVGQHEAARTWAKQHKRLLKSKTGVIQLNPKIDTKNQRRLQCSITLLNLKNAVKPEDQRIYTSSFGNLTLPFYIHSGTRKLNTPS